MKKFLCLVLVFVFTVGVMVGIGPSQVDARGSCYNVCGCNGVPLTCCVTPFGTFCFPGIGFGCPQIADC
ncbi:MAG: hypothetical protein DHS20C21_04070 [Gemmatimonadota bacterium]|nr:MAG: hypothetical protein DHS20C21_04070 [Gemmatimonadota bacterium]